MIGIDNCPFRRDGGTDTERERERAHCELAEATLRVYL